jgi:hypothetical protein
MKDHWDSEVPRADTIWWYSHIDMVDSMNEVWCRCVAEYSAAIHMVCYDWNKQRLKAVNKYFLVNEAIS